MAASQCRSRQSRPVEGGVGDRELPHGALGGHVMRCEDCLHTQIAYNSCRNRHCPKCQGSQALAWMKQRKSELLDVPYFHVVFTLPARIAAIAYQNKAVVYDLLFKASSQTMRTIAADPKRLGVKIGFPGTCFWPLIISKTRSSFHPLLARPCRSALPRERFSPLARNGHGAMSDLSPLSAQKQTSADDPVTISSTRRFR